MNSLLKRQIRKHLGQELASNNELKAFIDAIDKSYTNYDNQFSMQQRAMSISSEELYEANQKLRNEAQDQKAFIEKLKRVLKTLETTHLPLEVYRDKNEIDIFKLLDYLGNQTIKMVEINNQRKALLTELEHQNQELSDYAHMVSHDLKSPLRSIQTLTTWLKEDLNGRTNSSISEKFNLIDNQVEKMDALISGILEYSSIGRTKKEQYQVDLDLLFDDILNIIEVPENTIINKLDTLPVVSGDKFRYQQIFQNLISNAIKYNNKEQVLIEVGCKESSEYWEFFVKDNGIGIEERYFEKVFKTFETLDNSHNSTGIGLSIVRKIVEQYGGSIWIQSVPNQGSTFFFTIKKTQNGTA